MSWWDKDFAKGYKQKKTLFSAVKESILNKEIRKKQIWGENMMRWGA